MRDETEMMLLRVAYTITFRVRFLETDMGTFENATVSANHSNVFYMDKKANIKNHVLTELQKSAEDDEIIDIRILKTFGED